MKFLILHGTDYAAMANQLLRAADVAARIGRPAPRRCAQAKSCGGRTRVWRCDHASGACGPHN
ncbi:MAG: hypothetical protein V8T01_01140 [Oscillospiraceae bacterium]